MTVTEWNITQVCPWYTIGEDGLQLWIRKPLYLLAIIMIWVTKSYRAFPNWKVLWEIELTSTLKYYLLKLYVAVLLSACTQGAHAAVKPGVCCCLEEAYANEASLRGAPCTQAFRCVYSVSLLECIWKMCSRTLNIKG